MERQILDVSQVNEYIKNLMDGDELLAGLCIRGELSNYKIYPSGHHYFTLKDAGGALRCEMIRSSAARLRFRPENGMKVLAMGRITVFPRDGAMYRRTAWAICMSRLNSSSGSFLPRDCSTRSIKSRCRRFRTALQSSPPARARQSWTCCAFWESGIL